MARLRRCAVCNGFYPHPPHILPRSYRKSGNRPLRNIIGECVNMKIDFHVFLTVFCYDSFYYITVF